MPSPPKMKLVPRGQGMCLSKKGLVCQEDLGKSCSFIIGGLPNVRDIPLKSLIDKLKT
ncbi:unnamed protein product [Prunus brigantina]